MITRRTGLMDSSGFGPCAALRLMINKQKKSIDLPIHVLAQIEICRIFFSVCVLAVEKLFSVCLCLANVTTSKKYSNTQQQHTTELKSCKHHFRCQLTLRSRRAKKYKKYFFLFSFGYRKKNTARNQNQAEPVVHLVKASFSTIWMIHYTSRKSWRREEKNRLQIASCRSSNIAMSKENWSRFDVNERAWQ